MSKSQSKIPSPARSQGAVTPRRARTRRTLSTASPRSEASVKLSSVVENYLKDDFVLSPLKRRSVLPDDTEIEAPRRASWWKRLDGSTRDVLEALDTNTMTDDLMVEEFEFEVNKDKQNQSVPESSDNESIASIIVPQRRLFNQKKQPQGKFAEMGFRKSLGRTNIEDQSIELAPKTLFNKGPRNKPVFPAALLNSTNKTINKTVEPEPIKQTRPNLFGQVGTKRKNMFADFVLSDSEEDSEVQHKVFGFNKNNKRISFGTRKRRMPSLTPSITTEIDIDDWNLLPSSTMIGAQEVSRMSTDDVEQVQEENQDVTLTEQNESFTRDNNRSETVSRSEKSVIENDENDKTLTNEDLLDVSNQENKMNEFIKTNKTHEPSKNKSNESIKNKISQNKSSTRANAENEEVVLEQQNNSGTKNLTTEMNEQSLEDKMAELHGESIEKEKSLENIQLDRTKENLENYKDTKTGNYTNGKETHEIEPSVEERKLDDASKAANDANQNEDNDLSGKDESEGKLEQIIEERTSENRPKDASIINQDQDLNDKSKQDKGGEDMGPSVEDRVSEEHSREASSINQEEDMENKCEEEIEPSAEEQDTRHHSEEVSEINQDEEMNDMSEKDKSDEEVEPSAADDENQHETNEVTDENEDEVMEDISEKDKSKEIEHHQETQKYSEEESDQDEEMEEMVWNDNDDEKANDPSKAGMDVEPKQNDEVPNVKGSESGKNDRTVDRREITNRSKHVTNKSNKIVESFVDNDQMEEEIVDETPNNSTHNTTGRNRKKGTIIKSPEAVLQNMTSDNESFRPIGRSTTFRKSKSIYEIMNRTSLAPVQESILGSEGSRNSSTEGSEWDSHRTTRKTIRQTLGREYTTRKSLRALIMEQSAKRQTELYNKNTSNVNKTKNKTALDENDRNASKMNKTKNKTDSEVNNASTLNKTKNKTAAINNSRNKTVLEDDHHIRRRTPNRNLSNDQSLIASSPVHGTSTHHLPDPLISEHQISHHKSLHEMEDPEISDKTSNREDSINMLEYYDSGPEISMNASYGQGMSAARYERSAEEHEATDVEMNNFSKQIKEIPRNASVRSRSIRNSDQEILDYEASELEKKGEEKEDSELEKSENEVEALSDHEESEQENEDSQQEIASESENEESQQEIESEQEQSQQEIETEHENQQDIESEQEPEDEQDRESQQEIESDQEEFQQEIESEHETQQEMESEQEQDGESQQEIESDQEESQQEIESEHETQQEIESEQEDEQDRESQQEVESDQEESQQQIESEQDESQQEIELESENEQNNDVSQPESDHESDQENRELERDSEDDDFGLKLDSGHHANRSGVSRVVFDSQIMSADEIDFEGVSRQTYDDKEVSTHTDHDNTEQSVRELELSGNARITEPSVHEVSVGTKKSSLLMQMQKIAQKNMEIRQKIRNQVQKSLKPTRNYNMSPVPKYSVRRITKEPAKPKKKPTRCVVAMESLPNAFVEDLAYKPPKRFQKAPWMTKRLYKFLETKLEPKYDYRARVRAEELVESIYNFSKLVRRQQVAPTQAVDELKREMARLQIVNTHYEFYDFFFEFMPREVRIKVNPSIVNKIPMPRNGIFGEILQSRTAVE